MPRQLSVASGRCRMSGRRRCENRVAKRRRRLQKPRDVVAGRLILTAAAAHDRFPVTKSIHSCQNRIASVTTHCSVETSPALDSAGTRRHSHCWVCESIWLIFSGKYVSLRWSEVIVSCSNEVSWRLLLVEGRACFCRLWRLLPVTWHDTPTLPPLSPLLHPRHPYSLGTTWWQ